MTGFLDGSYTQPLYRRNQAPPCLKSTRGFSGARDAATPPPDVAVALPTHGKEIFPSHPRGSSMLSALAMSVRRVPSGASNCFSSRVLRHSKRLRESTRGVR